MEGDGDGDGKVEEVEEKRREENTAASLSAKTSFRAVYRETNSLA